MMLSKLKPFHLNAKRFSIQNNICSTPNRFTCKVVATRNFGVEVPRKSSNTESHNTLVKTIEVAIKDKDVSLFKRTWQSLYNSAQEANRKELLTQYEQSLHQLSESHSDPEMSMFAMHVTMLKHDGTEKLAGVLESAIFQNGEPRDMMLGLVEVNLKYKSSPNKTVILENVKDKQLHKQITDYVNHALAKFHIHEIDEAKECYMEALDLMYDNPAHDFNVHKAECFYGLGACHMALYQFEPAVAMFQEYIYLLRFTKQPTSPQEISSLIDMGASYQSLGDHDSAVRYLSQAKHLAQELNQVKLVKLADKHLWDLHKLLNS